MSCLISHYIRELPKVRAWVHLKHFSDVGRLHTYTEDFAVKVQ